MKINLDRFNKVTDADLYSYTGNVKQIIGMSIETKIPKAKIGDVCKIEKNDGSLIDAEVVGFKEDRKILMAIGDTDGIGQDSKVYTDDVSFTVKVSKYMTGRVLDGLGRPIDGKGDIIGKRKKINDVPPNPLTRRPIKEPLYTGVRAIDGLLTCGRGQRFGIFAGSGVGKSTLMGMIAKSSTADINVIALIGERGREVNDFIEKSLGKNGMKKSILVVSTSNEPAMMRLKGAYTATAIAEYFREMGMNVLLMMDSITRFAMAQREIGLAVGEPPVSKGYTPSVFTVLPKLLERTGNSGKGSITALYTVLVDGDDLTEPITDTVRSILDGHIVLTRKLANSNHFPAIDVLLSISRVMKDVVGKEHYDLANKIKNIMAVYRDFEDLISIGAYKKGNNPKVDEAIDKIDRINDFLIQRETSDMSQYNIINDMKKILGE